MNRLAVLATLVLVVGCGRDPHYCTTSECPNPKRDDVRLEETNWTCRCLADGGLVAIFPAYEGYAPRCGAGMHVEPQQDGREVCRPDVRPEFKPSASTQPFGPVDLFNDPRLAIYLRDNCPSGFSIGPSIECRTFPAKGVPK